MLTRLGGEEAIKRYQESGGQDDGSYGGYGGQQQGHPGGNFNFNFGDFNFGGAGGPGGNFGGFDFGGGEPVNFDDSDVELIEDSDDVHAFEKRRILYATLFYKGSELDDQEAVSFLLKGVSLK